MNYKNVVKNVLPNNFYKQFTKYKLSRLYKYDSQKFVDRYSSEIYSELNIGQINSRLLFYSHAIEKGLSRKNMRYGFGKEALKNIESLLYMYNLKGLDKEGGVYQSTISVLNEYEKIHKNHISEIKYFYDLFSNYLNEIEGNKKELSGSYVINSLSKENNKNCNFEDLALNRHSIREFSDEDIPKEQLENIVRIASKTPSVCNRQGGRIHFYKDPSLIGKVLNKQGGFKGYKLPKVLALVTIDIQAFLSTGERNQQYIDGGLFAMSILYGLEYEGLGACALNAMFYKENEENIRKILNLPSNENLIMFIAIGSFSGEIAVPKSYRMPIDNIAKFY